MLAAVGPPSRATLASLASRDAVLTETMDSPDCDPVILARTYAQFRFVNPFVSGWRTIYRRDIRPKLSATRSATLLDVGSGGGDVSRALAGWAARDGLRLTVTGIDPDPRAHAYATGQPAVTGLSFRRAFSSELVAEGAQFDFVVSNHILHHLTAVELGGVLFDSERLCGPGGRALHADIARSRYAYLGFALATWPFFHRSYIRQDGLASIRRSYTVAELRAAVPPGWLVTAGLPSRLVLRWMAPRSGASGLEEPGSSGSRPDGPEPAASGPDA